MNTLKNDVNLNKSSLKMEKTANKNGEFSVVFEFDSTYECMIKVYLMATEKLSSNNLPS